MFNIDIKLLTAAILVTLAAAGCGQQQQSKAPVAAAPAPQMAPAPQTAPAPAPMQAAAPAPPPAPQMQPVLATQQFSTNPNVYCDVLEVKRGSGGALLVKWRVYRLPPAPSAGGLAAPVDDKGIYVDFGWSSVYFTDPAENKKYSGLKDTQGNWIAQGQNMTYGPGQQQVMWMKFPAPPPTSARISFVFYGFAPFDDLPVAQ